MKEKIEQLFSIASKSDAILNKKIGYESNPIKSYLEDMIRNGFAEVGYRSSCGSTDYSVFVFREWKKILKKAEKLGIEIVEEPIKHGNSWATLSNGFWNSSKYFIVKGEN